MLNCCCCSSLTALRLKLCASTLACVLSNTGACPLYVNTPPVKKCHGSGSSNTQTKLNCGFCLRQFIPGSATANLLASVSIRNSLSRLIDRSSGGALPAPPHLHKIICRVSFCSGSLSKLWIAPFHQRATRQRRERESDRERANYEGG